MQDLQEVTQEIHYENFRSEKLAGGTTPARKITRSVTAQLFIPFGGLFQFNETSYLYDALRIWSSIPKHGYLPI